jgi:hypothetical protein
MNWNFIKAKEGTKHAVKQQRIAAKPTRGSMTI